MRRISPGKPSHLCFLPGEMEDMIVVIMFRTAVERKLQTGHEPCFRTSMLGCIAVFGE
jgi:hypothetical protein